MHGILQDMDLTCQESLTVWSCECCLHFRACSAWHNQLWSDGTSRKVRGSFACGAFASKMVLAHVLAADSHWPSISQHARQGPAYVNLLCLQPCPVMDMA